MRILLIAESLRPDAASLADSLVGLSRELRACGIHATLVSPERSGSGALGPEEPGVGSPPVADPVTAVAGHDLVHLIGWDYTLAQNALAAVGRERKPFIVSPAGSLDPLDKQRLRQRLRWWLTGSRALAKGRSLLAMNEWELTRLRQLSPRARIGLLPFGVDTEASVPRNSFGSATDGSDFEAPFPSSRRDRGITTSGGESLSQPGRPYVLVLGPIDPPSGAVALLKALAELGPDADGWSVVFAGHLEQHWQQMLEAAIRRKGGEQRVRFVNDPDLAMQQQLLAACGFLVAPALRSRPPMAMMQALAAGVPACGTACAAPPEIDCLTCEPNRAAMREMLRSMIRRSESEKRETTARQTEQVRHRFAWSNLIDRYISLYREFLT